MIAEVVFLLVCFLQFVVYSYSRLKVVKPAETYNNDAASQY